MITFYAANQGLLARRENPTAIDPAVVWVDLLNPTRAEDLLVEEALGISIPTREEAQEIEASSRIYTEDNALFMTAVMLHQPDPAFAPPTGAPNTPGPDTSPPTPGHTPASIHTGPAFPARDFIMPRQSPTTFILTRTHLVTVRYDHLRSFDIFQQRASKKDVACHTAAATLLGLLETIIDRESDRIERITADVEKLSHTIFDMRGGQASRSRRFDVAIKMIGRQGEMISRESESLHSFERLITYLGQVFADRGEDKHLRARIKTAGRDLSSLIHHNDALSQKIQFLLDATLGLVSIEQNTIIKLFSVASVALMPPTLIASIYGMNFKHMPELDWPWGYPLAIALMITSAVVPFTYFKRKGWF